MAARHLPHRLFGAGAGPTGTIIKDFLHLVSRKNWRDAPEWLQDPHQPIGRPALCTRCNRFPPNGKPYKPWPLFQAWRRPCLQVAHRHYPDSPASVRRTTRRVGHHSFQLLAHHRLRASTGWCSRSSSTSLRRLWPGSLGEGVSSTFGSAGHILIIRINRSSAVTARVSKPFPWGLFSLRFLPFFANQVSELTDSLLLICFFG